jgi:hypothetical protein
MTTTTTTRTTLEEYVHRRILWVRFSATIDANDMELHVLNRLAEVKIRKMPGATERWFRKWNVVEEEDRGIRGEDRALVSNMSLAFPDCMSAASALHVIRQSPFVSTGDMCASYLVPKHRREVFFSVATNSRHVVHCKGFSISRTSVLDLLKHFQCCGEIFDIRFQTTMTSVVASVRYMASTAADNALVILNGIPHSFDATPLEVFTCNDRVQNHTENNNVRVNDEVVNNETTDYDTTERLETALVELRTKILSTCICPLTLLPMENPVVAWDGFTYELDAISNWLRRECTSPMNGLVIPPVFMTNLIVRRIGEALL